MTRHVKFSLSKHEISAPALPLVLILVGGLPFLWFDVLHQHSAAHPVREMGYSKRGAIEPEDPPLRGASISKPTETRPWGAADFHIDDPDGYILCFSQGT